MLQSYATFITIPYLLLLGFVLGLSGALIPGPLLFYTLNCALKKGWRAGSEVIVGHAMVEVVVIMALISGFSGILVSHSFYKWSGIIGGVILVYTAWRLNYIKSSEVDETSTLSSSTSTVLGGVVFTAFNPSFPAWWATVGIRMLWEGYEKIGYEGMLWVVVGHWIADFGWYIAIAHTTYRGSKRLISTHAEKILRRVIALLLGCIGGYFIFTGVIS